MISVHHGALHELPLAVGLEVRSVRLTSMSIDADSGPVHVFCTTECLLNGLNSDYPGSYEFLLIWRLKHFDKLLNMGEY